MSWVYTDSQDTLCPGCLSTVHRLSGYTVSWVSVYSTQTLRIHCVLGVCLQYTDSQDTLCPGCLSTVHRLSGYTVSWVSVYSTQTLSVSWVSVYSTQTLRIHGVLGVCLQYTDSQDTLCPGCRLNSNK